MPADLMRIALVALLAITAKVARSQDMNLKGIKAVQVEINSLDGVGTGPCAEKVLARKIGLQEEPIRTETELRLRQAGLRIGRGRFLELALSPARAQ